MSWIESLGFYTHTGVERVLNSMSKYLLAHKGVGIDITKTKSFVLISYLKEKRFTVGIR